jgi:uncharacterized protein
MTRRRFEYRRLDNEFDQSRNAEVQDPIVIPHTELSPDALRGVMESFVLREGTDYGDRDFSLEQKVSHVLRQLERGEAQVIFDPNTETVDIQTVRGRVRTKT